MENMKKDGWNVEVGFYTFSPKHIVTHHIHSTIGMMNR